jgi:hydrogenase nickel incorporation protein HypA/HybF
MHEAPMAQALLDTAIASLPSPNARITKVVIVAGPFSGIEKESLTFYFDQLCRGTPAEGAILEVKSEPAKLVCKQCGQVKAYDSDSQIELTCSACGGQNKLEGGNAAYLESIEVEEE